MEPTIALAQNNVIKDTIDFIKSGLHQQGKNSEILVKVISIHETEDGEGDEVQTGKVCMLLYIAQRIQCEVNLAIYVSPDNKTDFHYTDISVYIVDGDAHEIYNGQFYDFYESYDDDVNYSIVFDTRFIFTCHN